MSDNLELDQVQHYVGPDMGLNYLRRLKALAAGDKSSTRPLVITSEI